MKKIALLLLLFLAIVKTSYSEKPPEIGIVEKLGNQIPLDLEFTSSDGTKKKLRDVIDKPTILSLVYYNCPGICSPLLTNMSEVMDKVKLEPGKHFKALTISFDHREGADKAKRWKENYLASMKRPFGAENWEFMVGDSVTIRKLTDAVGFYFKPEGNDYVHPGSLFILTPDGKVSRYLLGIEYNPFDLQMSISEAAKGKSMPTVTKILQYCFSYDPEGKKYVFNVTKVAGTVIFLAAGIFFITLVFMGKSKRKKKNMEDNSNEQ